MAGDTYSVTVEVANTRAIPTISARSSDKKIGARDSVTLSAVEGSTVQVLASGTVTDRYLASLELTKRDPARIWVSSGISGHGSRHFRWIVQGSGAVELVYRAEKASPVSKPIDLTPGVMETSMDD